MPRLYWQSAADAKAARKRRKDEDTSASHKPPDVSGAEFTVPVPESVQDLAVDERKQKEIRDWLTDSLSPDLFEALSENGQTAPRILLVRGPAGCGKTTTIRLLAKSLDIEVREYALAEDEVHILHGDDDVGVDRKQPQQYAPSHTKNFESFLKDSDRYICTGTCHKPKRINLVEELPNVFVMRPAEFQSLIRRYVKLFPQHTPIVFTWTTCANTTDAFRVFTSAMMTELNFKQIDFNPVSKTLLRKSLTRLPVASLIPKDELDSIIEWCSGDLRVLFNEIELKFKYALDDVSPGSPVVKKKVKKSATGKMLSQRQLFGNNFHLLGKIIYPKRLLNDTSADYETNQRRFPLVTSPSLISRDMPWTSINLILKLHQLYLKRIRSVDQAARCSDVLSLSEIISRADFMENRAYFQNYAADISISGLMYSIPPQLVDEDGKAVCKSNNCGLILQRTPVIYSCDEFCKNMRRTALTLPQHEPDFLSCHKPADLFTDILSLLSHPDYLHQLRPSQVTAMISEISAMAKKCGSQSNDDKNDAEANYNQESCYVTRKLSEVRLRDCDTSSGIRNHIRIKGLGDSDDPDDYQIDD